MSSEYHTHNAEKFITLLIPQHNSQIRDRYDYALPKVGAYLKTLPI